MSPPIRTQRLPRPAPARVLACGAWLKNTACLIDGDEAHWSPLNGDLSDPAACARLDAAIEALRGRAGGALQAVAHDLHPDFPSTRAAQALAARLGVPALGVQHHHAHIAVVQAEQGLQGPLIGLALDGFGLGLDGSAWGGELLWVDGARWQRVDHLGPLPLPGGDAAAREPWRMAAAALHALGRGDEIAPRLAPAVGEAAARVVQAMLARGLHCPASTAAGRWFDAAAGLLGISLRQAHEAEAAMALERLATDYLEHHPAPPLPRPSLDLRPVLARLLALAEPVAGAPAATGPATAGRAARQAEGAALFHLALADALVNAAAQQAGRHQANTVVLGGGCFLNRLLTQRVSAGLQARGLRVAPPASIGCGDVGLALGQAWVAAGTLAARSPTSPEE